MSGKTVTRRITSKAGITTGRGLTRLIVMGLLWSVIGQFVVAAPPPPRRGGTPYMPPAPPSAILFNATPLSKIIETHEKEQKINSADVHRLNIAEMAKVLREDYLAHGSRNEKWDGPLLKAIDETIHCLTINASEPQRKKLVHMLRLPARYKCDDPRYYYMFVYARNYRASHENMQALAKGIELARTKPKHHRHLIWLMNLRLSQIQLQWHKKPEATASRQAARKTFVQWLEHDLPQFDPNLIYDWIDYFDELIDPVSVTPEEEAAIRLTMEQISKIEHLAPWMQSLLQARAAMQWAWAVRGHGYAHTVTDDAWNVWYEKNALAYRMAVSAHELNPNQALAATLLIPICRSMNPDHGKKFVPRYWFEQATSAMVDYDKAYMFYATGLLPRWGGSTQMQLDFAWECAATRRYDSDIPLYATHVLRHIRSDLDSKDAPFDSRYARQINAVLQHVMTGYLDHEKDPHVRQLLQQFWLNWTSRLDLPQQALRVHALLDQPYDARLPYNKKYYLMNLSSHDLNVLLARGRPEGEMLTRAIHAEKFDKNWPAAKQLYNTIISKGQANTAGVTYARNRIQHHAWQEILETGQWVPLKFDEHLTGWKPFAGHWKRIDENTIQGVNDELPMRIAPIIDLGKYYEWQMTIHFIHKAKGPALMAGIVYAYENHPEHYGQFGQFLRHQPGSTWYHMNGYEPYRSGNVEVPEKMTCNIVVKNGRFSIFINGKQVQKPLWIMRDSSFLKLAMGTAFSRNPGSIIQYSDIRVRKLPESDNQSDEQS